MAFGSKNRPGKRRSLARRPLTLRRYMVSVQSSRGSGKVEVTARTHEDAATMGIIRTILLPQSHKVVPKNLRVVTTDLSKKRDNKRYFQRSDIKKG